MLYNHNMLILLTALAVFALLLISEFWHRRRGPHGELSRKFVHITVGSFVAYWPHYLSADTIKLFSVAFLVVAMLSKYFHIFRAIHSVQRPTQGEFWFALVVGLLAFTIYQHPHIYTTALLEMSLADGLAAVIGTRYGNRYRYSVFGAPKSVIGTSTFFVVTCVILARYSMMTPGALSLSILVPVALIATLLENVAVRGLDNLAVPVFIAGVLLHFA